ncbi:hypothetical protein D9615_003596 [Tricholomella constricta]|uniref:Peptidase M50B-like protein n=1 Tax=Tricholomella constricta TaxID=117010 RepID=A0A8H5HHA3_9AGAR|nr:hypothetical protein D9615_003596 [Tricholomella constricta]
MVSGPPVAPPIGTPTPTPGPGAIVPSNDQVVVIYVILAMSVIIFGFWNVPIVRNLINPLKLFTIGLHELCHITAAVLTGGRILRITIDPHIGGATIVEGGRPTFILASGYLGSTLLGGLFVLAGYSTLVAKVMSFVLGIGLMMPLALVRDKLTIVLTVLYEGLLIGFWFIDHAVQPTSAMVLSIYWHDEVRTPSSRLTTELIARSRSVFFVVWDVADDRFFHKTNDSDATQFSLLYPRLGPHVWAAIWIMFEIAVLAGFIVLGIFVFKLTEDEMNAQAG